MYAELEHNPIDSQECAKYEGVSHNLWYNNMPYFFSQMDIPTNAIYCRQSCMMSMDHATSMYGNEEKLSIDSNIEIYY